VTVEGWNLPNILRFGGVCADQAHFAATVGKAIGVPTAYTSGRSSRVSHAWVGFLQSDGRRGWWNFNSGRYRAYQGVRGVVFNPQIRRRIPDSYVSLLADVTHVRELDRQFVAAATDAARRLASLETSGDLFDPPMPQIASGELTKRREATLADQLELIEAGLRACAGHVDAWFTVRQLAEHGRLSLKQKRRWAKVLDRLCGERYPDFLFDMLAPMIETVDEVDEQNRFWNRAFKRFGRRHDLAAAVRMRQGEMWLEAGDKNKAGHCYEYVIEHYANAGPFVIDALLKAEKLLRREGDGQRILRLYDKAWSLTEHPGEMAGVFAGQSNWFRVGTLYAMRLEEAGLQSQAANIRAALQVR
jgi:hypothetical protein